jgi:hypothetical protein
MFQDYWWPQFWKYVKDFIGSCDVYVQAKNPCHHFHGFFQPLLIPTSLQLSISMDFNIDLAPFNSYDCILVVVDCLTKMFHFIPCTKKITTK